MKEGDKGGVCSLFVCTALGFFAVQKKILTETNIFSNGEVSHGEKSAHGMYNQFVEEL